MFKFSTPNTFIPHTFNPHQIDMSEIEMSLCLRSFRDLPLIPTEEIDSYAVAYKAGQCIALIPRYITDLSNKGESTVSMEHHRDSFEEVLDEFFRNGSLLFKEKATWNEEAQELWYKKDDLDKIDEKIRYRNTLLSAVYLGWRSVTFGKVLFQFDTTLSLVYELILPPLLKILINDEWHYTLHYGCFDWYNAEGTWGKSPTSPNPWREWAEHKFCSRWDIEPLMFFSDDLCKDNPKERLDVLHNQIGKDKFHHFAFLDILTDEEREEFVLFKDMVKAAGLTKEGESDRLVLFKFKPMSLVEPESDVEERWKNFLSVSKNITG